LDTLAFIARYEAILKEKRIPKMVFYKECGITDAAVSQWRKGKTAPATKTISRIADFLGVTAESLLVDSDTPKRVVTFSAKDVAAAIKVALEEESKRKEEEAKKKESQKIDFNWKVKEEQEKPTRSGELSDIRKQFIDAIDDMSAEELLFLLSKAKVIKDMRE
jgi:transcriptional regulator with XRE-family HTH domain